MKHAVLARCPVIGGKVAAFDDQESKKVTGVSYVGKISDSAIAIVADSVWGAMEGRRALDLSWNEGPNRDLDSAAILVSLKKSASDKAPTLFHGRYFEGLRTPSRRRVSTSVHGARADGAGQQCGSFSRIEL